MKKKPQPRGSMVFGVVADLHAGSTLGLCPPQGVTLDEGGHYAPSREQLWLWDRFVGGTDHFERVLEEERVFAKAGTDREPADPTFGLVSNGDVTDGNHHQTPQIFTKLEGYHVKMALDCLEVPLRLKPEHVWIIRGTEAHVGMNGGLEQGVAHALHKDGWPVERDPSTRTASRWSARMEVHGRLLDFTHHGRMGQRAHTRAGYVRHYAFDIWAEHQMAGERAPDLAVRSHNHLYEDSGDQHPVKPTTRVIQTGAFQLCTAYGWKKHPDSLAHIGVVAIVVRPDGRIRVEPHITKPNRSKPWSR